MIHILDSLIENLRKNTKTNQLVSLFLYHTTQQLVNQSNVNMKETITNSIRAKVIYGDNLDDYLFFLTINKLAVCSTLLALEYNIIAP